MGHSNKEQKPRYLQKRHKTRNTQGSRKAKRLSGNRFRYPKIRKGLYGSNHPLTPSTMCGILGVPWRHMSPDSRKRKRVETMTKKQVQVNDEQMPAWMQKQQQGSVGRGSEDVEMDDMSVPRIEIIQDISPQIKKSKEEYIEGAEAKMCFNTATKRLYGGSITVVPVYFRKEWVNWRDRKEGGGFGGAFDNEREANEERQNLENPDSWESTETHQQFVLIINPDGHIEQAVLSMSKSKRKISRDWNTMIRAAGGDRFCRQYTLSVVDAQNANGEDYYNWKATPSGFVNEEVYSLAEEMYDSIKAGKKDVSRKTEGDGSVSATQEAAEETDIPEDEFDVPQ